MSDDNGELDTLEPAGDEDTLEPQDADAETAPENDSLDHWKQLAQNYKIRAEKAEAKAKKADDPVAKAQATQPKTKIDNSALAQLEKRFDTKSDLRMAGYSVEEIRFIEANAPNGDLTQALESKSGKLRPKDEFVYQGIMALRRKAQVGQGTQPPSKRASVDSTIKSFKETPQAEKAQKYSFDAWRQKNSKEG